MHFYTDCQVTLYYNFCIYEVNLITFLFSCALLFNDFEVFTYFRIFVQCNPALQPMLNLGPFEKLCVWVHRWLFQDSVVLCLLNHFRKHRVTIQRFEALWDTACLRHSWGSSLVITLGTVTKAASYHISPELHKPPRQQDSENITRVPKGTFYCSKVALSNLRRLWSSQLCLI